MVEVGSSRRGDQSNRHSSVILRLTRGCNEETLNAILNKLSNKGLLQSPLKEIFLPNHFTIHYPKQLPKNITDYWRRTTGVRQYM